MQGQYDDLAQESWDSACDRMPQDYLDNVMAQIGKPRKSIHDPDNIYERARIADCAREFGKFHPRVGQPELYPVGYSNMREWYLEGLRRADEIPLFPYHIKERTPS